MAKGFNRPAGGGMGGGGGMMAQIKRLQEQMAVAQEQLAIDTVTSSAGGGAVKVTMTGDQHCKEVIIDPELLKTRTLKCCKISSSAPSTWHWMTAARWPRKSSVRWPVVCPEWVSRLLLCQFCPSRSKT